MVCSKLGAVMGLTPAMGLMALACEGGIVPAALKQAVVAGVPPMQAGGVAVWLQK
jgi:hypothetical protein